MTLTRFTAPLAALFLATTALAEGIDVQDPYARANNPNAPTGAAFMVIRNTGQTADRLIGVTSDAAARTELHTHVEEEGLMRMIHVEEGFDLPPETVLVLERGGNHVMFMGLTTPFEQDALIEVTLLFEEAGEITVEIPVDLERAAKDAHGHGDHGDHASDG